MRGYFVTILVLAFLCSPAVGKKKSKKVEIITEFKPEDCSEASQDGDTLVVHYTGALEDGQIFDSSRGQGREPFSLVLGAKEVIRGWDEGLGDMCVGEVRKLIVPSELAYGDQGVKGIIPGGATLVFSVELLELKKKPFIKVPSGSGFYGYVGVVLVLGLVGYELYRRAANSSAESKRSKKSREHPSKRTQQRNKRKQ